MKHYFAAWFGYYRPQTKFAKVMFSQVSVCPQGEGACMVEGHALKRVRVACMVGGMCGRGACVVGACIAWGMCARGMHGRGHAWHEAYVAGVHVW